MITGPIKELLIGIADDAIVTRTSAGDSLRRFARRVEWRWSTLPPRNGDEFWLSRCRSRSFDTLAVSEANKCIAPTQAIKSMTEWWARQDSNL